MVKLRHYMKWLKRSATIILLIVACFALQKSTVFAAACQATFSTSINPNNSQTITVDLPNPSRVNADNVALCSAADGVFPDTDSSDPVGKYCYRLSMCNTGVGGAGGCSAFPNGSWFFPGNQRITNSGTTIELTDWKYDKGYTFKLESNDLLNGSSGPLGSSRLMACSTEWKVNVIAAPASCDSGAFTLSGPNGTTKNPLTLNFDGTKTHNFFRGLYELQVQAAGGGNARTIQSLSAGGDGLAWGAAGGVQTGSADIGTLAPGGWEIVITSSVEGTNYCRLPFTMSTDGVEQQPDANITSAPFKLCDQAVEEDKAKCIQCTAGGDILNPESNGLWTAFGCVKTSKEGIVQNIIQIGLGLAGGFVLLSILYGAFLLTTSSGDTKRVQEGQEMISSAVMGLVFVIFSIMILQFIGVSVLRIPGFGGP